MSSAKASRKRRESQQIKPAPAEVLAPPSILFSWQRWAVLVCCGMLVVALRTPKAWLHQNFYAEDGMIFFQQQFLEGWRAIFHTYSGYFNLLPRLAAFASSFGPIRDQPTLFAICNVVVQSLAASFFFLPQNRVLVRSDSLRLLICLLALADYQGIEMLNCILAIQWFLMPVALMMLCHLGSHEMPLSRTRVLLYAVLMTAICLSMPLLLFAAPIALFFLVWAPRGEKLIPACMLAAITAQGITFARTGIPESHTAAVPLSLFTALRPLVATMGAWVYRDIFTILLGEPAAIFLAAHGGQTFAAVALLAVVLATGYVSEKLSRTQRILFISALVTSIGLVATSLVVRRMLNFFGDLTHYNFFGGAARYFLVSGWIVLVLSAMTVERLCAKRSHFARAAILLAIFGLGAINNFDVADLPDQHWSDYAPAMEQWKVKRDRHEPTPRMVSPTDPPGWGVELPAYPAR